MFGIGQILYKMRKNVGLLFIRTELRQKTEKYKCVKTTKQRLLALRQIKAQLSTWSSVGNRMIENAETVFTCLEGKGGPENARVSLVAEDETAFEHTSETDRKMQLLKQTPARYVAHL